MKRHGGGRGGAKARGVLRDDKGGFSPTGGNGTGASPGGNGTGASPGGNGTGASPGGNGTGGLHVGSGIGNLPLGNATGGLPLVNSAGGNDSTTSMHLLLGAEPGDPKTKVMSHFPAVMKDRNCECIFETDEAPYTAIIVYKNSGNLLCFGSIVDHLHVLTSKRCLNKVEAGDLRVVLGCLKAWWGRNAQIIKVKKIMRHEFEAALLWLKTEVTFTDFVQPAKLPSSFLKWSQLSSLYKGSYYITGFFLESDNEPGGRIGKDNYYRLKGDKFISLTECKKFYSSETLEDKSVFCTMGNATFCWGGWGSPILFWQGKYFIQIGFVIADCCAANETGPFLAARTDYYGDWINGLVYDFHKPS